MPGELTHSQLPIAIGQRLHPGTPLYNMAFAFVLPTDLDIEFFQRAWTRVAEASDALRTRVTELPGGGLRLAEPGGQLAEVPEARVERLAEGGQGGVDDETFLSWARERSARPLDLRGPLVESVLVPLSGRRTGWYLNQHHLVTDAASTQLLFRLVGEQYEALLLDENSSLELPAYRDAFDSRSRRPSETSEAHWAERRERAGRRVALYGRGHAAGTRSERLTLDLGDERSRALDALATEPGFASLSRDLSRFAVLATVLSVYLHRVSGRREVAFDAPVAGRTTAESQRTPGVFIEMFPFAAEARPGDTFRDLGSRCLEEAMLFLRHAAPGLSSPSGADAGNVVLNFIPASFGTFGKRKPERIEWLHPGHGDSVHALRLQAHDFLGTGRTMLHFDWNEGALPERLRRRAMEHFETLLDTCLTDPDQAIGSVDVRTEDERLAFASFRPTDRTPRQDRTLIELFEEQSRSEPERIALRLIEDGRSTEDVTFGELRRRVRALAAHLVRQGVAPGDRVAVLGRRSVDAVVSILAALRARAAYVPIDPSYPAARRELVLRDSGAKIFLKELPDLEAAVDNAALDDAALDDAQLDPPRLDDLAYLLYTSGSTGRPKGVLVEHAGLADYLDWASRRYVRGDRLVFPLFTSLSFDLTVTSLFLPLLTGGTLEIYPQPDGPVDTALLDVVRRNSADFLKLTPSHLSLLRRAGLDDTCRVRRMVVGGEDLKASLAAAVSSQLADRVEIHNEYGPTEAVVGCVAHLFDPASDLEGSVPIGRTADHVVVEVLSDEGVPVPEGVPGELWIARHGLARGYHGRDDLTAERFQQDPQTGIRRYRTGDLVRLVDAETLEFLGRVDRQVKVSGFRIEPGEIESALLRASGVEDCAVVARQTSPRRRMIDAGGVAREVTGAQDSVRHCTRCGLPSTYPRAVVHDDGVCSICRAYDRVREHARAYFRDMDDLESILREAGTRRREWSTDRTMEAEAGGYDAMVLFSGGKDSTYALCRLAEVGERLGLRLRAFTLDNGFLSDGAKENIRRVTEQLGVDVEFATTPAMNAIFRDSLARFSNVCNGCFKTIYTLAIRRAHELRIPALVTGLSRGQMFETRLTEEMFREGRIRPEEVDAAVLASRKAYHRASDEVSRSLDVSLLRSDEIFDEVRIVDFYRYCDVSLDEMYAYLRERVPWVRPEDTGRSTNCLINDAGIFVHKKERGFHNYALPYSWDVRMGHKTRDDALAELDDEIDIEAVRRILDEVGYEPGSDRAEERTTLEAFYLGDASEDDVRRSLSEQLPAALIPAKLRRVDEIPLTAHGKVDIDALLARSDEMSDQTAEAHTFEPPEGPVQEYLAELWRGELAVERVGAGDSFFDLGGTSLLAMRVMLRLCEEFDIDVPLEAAFSYPTLRGLSRVAEDRILADAEAL